jgi:hypothetical protein
MRYHGSMSNSIELHSLSGTGISTCSAIEIDIDLVTLGKNKITYVF